MKVKGFKRIACAVLCAALLIGQFAGIPMTAGAVTVSDTHNGIGTKIADAATVNGWQELFAPDNTGHAGGVWTDKSVFVSAADYISATAEAETGDAQEKLAIDPDNFLVSLSAMASSKSIIGYTNTPTDTMLVLDVSSSMINNRSIDELAKAANAAIRELLDLNNHNRVGVVLYAGNTAGNFTTNAVGTTLVLMPLDRYTASTDVDGDGLYDYLYYNKSGNAADWNNIYIVDGVENSDNEEVEGSKTTASGTFIQDGIYVAMNQFLRSDIETVIPSGQIQAGTERMPIMVLMTDGEPTLGQTDFDGNNGALGPNNMNFMSHGYHDITFLSQLTAAYAKQQIDNKYGVSPLFYTLGLNVDENEALVMDPAMPGADQDLLDRFDGYWEDLKTTGTANMIDSRQTSGGRPGQSGQTTYTRTVTYDTAAIAELEAYRYYTDKYFRAADENSLTGAFEEIVEQIVIQSLYYPTLVESGQVHGDGYLTFIDYIGEGMEVKSIKGIQLGNTVFDGSKLARFIVTGSAGTEQDPTELGNNLVWALTERLGLTRGTDTQIVRNLLAQAYNAGQISYNASTGEFSNYVGWYGDASGKFLGFWDGKEPYTNVPSGAVAANKSYLFLDAVGAGHRETDILYASIQVSTTIADYTSGRGAQMSVGDSMVFARIPASLIPLIQYEIILNSTDVTDVESLTVTGATAPSRLLYEVGVKSSIDLLDMASSGLTPNANGEYIFYTNDWTDGWNGSNIESQQVWTDNAYAMFEPSQENEHYYYHENTLLYSDTNGTPLTSDPGNSSCYHRYLVYKLGAGGNATYEYEYEPVSEEVRSDANNFGVSSNGQYYVKKGVIHRYTAEHVHTKLANETGTADYASYPYVHHTDAASADGEYHIDDVLGNNGKLVLVPYEGLKITKAVDSTLSGTDTYNFDIVCTENNFSGAVTLVLQEADGTRTYTQTAFANGTLSVSLKPGQTVYVVGQAMTGKTFTVSEQIVTGEFKVSDVVVSNGTDSDLDPDTATVAVADGLITGVHFTNTKVVTGDVAIAKTVISDIASHKTAMDFTFEVTLDAPAGIGLKSSYPAELVATTDTGISVVYGSVTVNTLTGKVTGFTADGATSDIVLQHTDYLLIQGLEEGITVEVTETDLPAGFSITSVSDDDADTSASETEGNATIEVGQTKVIHFTNTYSAAPTDETDFNINITKDLIDASTWDGNFNFKVQRLNVATGEYMDVAGAVGSVSKAAGDALTDEDGDGQTDDWTETTVIIRERTYDAAGIYSYRIVEVIPDSPDPAIVYDPVMAYFTVTVTDPGNGKLIVSDVSAGTDAVVGTPVKNTAGHVTEVSVSASFVNTYAVDGAAEAVIHIDKIIQSTDSQATIRPEGFKFDLYSATVSGGVWTAGQKVKENITTDLAGDAVVNLVYTGANQNGTYHYILKEQAGSNPNVTYSTQEYHITVVVSEVAGQYAVSVEVTDADGNAVGSDSSAPAVAPAIPVVTVNEGTYTVTAEEGADLYIAANGGDWFKASGNTYTAEILEPMLNVTAFAVKNGLFSQQISVTGHIMGAEMDLDQRTFDISIDPSCTQVTDVATSKCEIQLVNHGPLGRAGLLEYYYKTAEDGAWTLYTGPIDLTDSASRPTEIYAYAQFGTVQSEQIIVATITYNDGVSVGELAYADVTRTYISNPNYSAPSTGTGIAKAEITSGVTFTNKFTPDPVSLTIPVSGTKVINGWPADVTAPDFTFELYKADNNWNLLDADATADGVNPMYVQTVNGLDLADGIEGFVFNMDGTDKPFTTSGYYYSVMKERMPAEATAANNYTVNGVTYDPTEYRIIAQVTGDSSTGKLTATIISVTTASGAESVAVFNNTYRAEPATASINGNKTLNSTLWTLNPNTFSFALYETDDTYTAGQTPIQTVTNGIGADIGAFRFDLSFDTAGDYYYVVKEVVPAGVDSSNPTKNGITFDTTEYKVKVTVTDNGTGVLTAVADIVDDADDVAAFTNSYSVTGTSSIITGVKNLDGAILSGNYDANTSFADLFEFELYSASVDGSVWTEGALLGTTNPDDAGNFSFTVGEFTRPDNHYYIIKEKVTSSDALIEYDPAVYHVTVNVVDNLDGTLVSYWSAVKRGHSGAYDASAPVTFYNMVAPVEVALTDLGGSKVFSGWSGATNPIFTFGLYASNENGEKLDGDPNVDGVNPLLTADVAGSGTFTFADVADSDPSDHVDDGTHYLTFSTADTRYYLITEEIPSDAVNNEKDGITYSPARYLVKIEVTMTEAAAQGPVRDTLNATVTYYSLNEQGVKTEIQKANVIFSNDYATTPDGQIHLGGSKTMIGRSLEDGDYTFNLFTATFDTTTNTVQASQIRKSQASNVGTAFAFDGFTVTTAGDHYFVIQENIPTGAVEVTTGSMAGKWLKDGIYYDATRYVAKVTATDTGTGKLTFSQPEYFLLNADGTIGSAAAAAFVNTYVADPVDIPADVQIQGSKTLAGGPDIQAGDFTFKMFRADDAWNKAQGEPLTAEVQADGTFTFVNTNAANENFVAYVAGTYNFIIEEVAGTDTRVTYDTNKYYVTYTVKDDGRGQLYVDETLTVIKKVVIENSAPVLSDATSVSFLNTYDPLATSFTVDGQKVLLDYAGQETELNGRKFRFSIYSANAVFQVADDAQPIETVENNGDGEFSFEVPLTTAGNHYFVVMEEAGTEDGMTYDATRYEIRVQVSNVQGQLQVDHVVLMSNDQIASEMVFTNTYAPAPDPDDITVSLTVEKILENKDAYTGTLEGFKFELTDANGNVLATRTTDASGKALFQITYPGYEFAGHTYTYYIREVDTGIENIVYSTKQYKVEVTVGYNRADDVLTASVKKDGQALQSGETFVFTNVYNAPPKPSDPVPPTGDHTTILYMATFAASIFGFVVTAMMSLRRKRRG